MTNHFTISSSAPVTYSNHEYDVLTDQIQLLDKHLASTKAMIEEAKAAHDSGTVRKLQKSISEASEHRTALYNQRSMVKQPVISASYRSKTQLDILNHRYEAALKERIAVLANFQGSDALYHIEHHLDDLVHCEIVIDWLGRTLWALAGKGNSSTDVEETLRTLVHSLTDKVLRETRYGTSSSNVASNLIKQLGLQYMAQLLDDLSSARFSEDVTEPDSLTYPIVVTLVEG